MSRFFLTTETDSPSTQEMADAIKGWLDRSDLPTLSVVPLDAEVEGQFFPKVHAVRDWGEFRSRLDDITREEQDWSNSMLTAIGILRDGNPRDGIYLLEGLYRDMEHTALHRRQCSGKAERFVNLP